MWPVGRGTRSGAAGRFGAPPGADCEDLRVCSGVVRTDSFTGAFATHRQSPMPDAADPPQRISNERVSAYTGSNKAISVERHSIRKEQLLQALPLVERRLHPQVRRTR